jgi:hypothetical protein
MSGALSRHSARRDADPGGEGFTSTCLPPIDSAPRNSNHNEHFGPDRLAIITYSQDTTKLNSAIPDTKETR